MLYVYVMCKWPSLQGPVVEESHGVTKDPTRVPTERCASLITVAIANRLDEVWISRNPVLFFVYVLQYAPNLGQWSVCYEGLSYVTDDVM